MDAATDFSWAALPERYRLILCDLWGVVHDGVRLKPGAAGRLRSWRAEGRFVVLLTNAARTADLVERDLRALGLSRDCWDSILTAGDVGSATLAAMGRPVGFLGTPDDRAALEARGVRISEDDDFSDLACSGLEPAGPRIEQYTGELERWAARGVRLHCLNPDRMVMHGGVAELCAGAIADRYEAMGGPVEWYGKPYRPVYQHALRLAGDPPRESVLAIGDGLRTDMLGAARMGFDAVFVRGALDAGKSFPSDFAAASGLGDWQPIATVDGLA